MFSFCTEINSNFTVSQQMAHSRNILPVVQVKGPLRAAEAMMMMMMMMTVHLTRLRITQT